MKTCVRIVFGLLLAVPASAHHGVNALYDVKKYVELTGILTKAELVNPHSHLYFDVAGVDGTVAKWSVETGSPGSLRRAGMTSETFRVGETCQLVVFPARDGSPNGLLSSITRADGRSYRIDSPKKP
jgi:uncharacterized protein DUF6152